MGGSGTVMRPKEAGLYANLQMKAHFQDAQEAASNHL
jgi:hypothetical protein